MTFAYNTNLRIARDMSQEMGGKTKARNELSILGGEVIRKANETKTEA